MSRLFLVGLPGAGKTTLGQALAAHLRLPFLDLDAEVVRRVGQPVSAIFEQQGEACFRQLEAATLREAVLQAGSLVLATGGGTPCFHQNMPWLNAHGLTLWLDVPLPVLARRLQAAAPTRPLLAGRNADAWLRESLAVRRPFYRQAQLRCAAETCTVAGVLPLLAAAGFPAGRTHPAGSA